MRLAKEDDFSSYQGRMKMSLLEWTGPYPLSCAHTGSLTKGTELPTSAKGLFDIATAKLRSKVTEQNKAPSLQTVEVDQETELQGGSEISSLSAALLLLLCTALGTRS